MKSLILTAFAALFLFQSCDPSSSAEILTDKDISKFLHVPSPEWGDQILYFIVIDRFMDGDTTNNDQGAGEYKKGDDGFWNGGDLKGITQKIDYIKELGATGVWITPPVANQWVNPQKTGTGNHGYWASSFVEVDKHYGTLEDYQELSARLHQNGMYLIQDVVVNHLGDFYTYTGEYNPDDLTQNFKVNDVPQPTQDLFKHNNALDPKDREMAVFHFAPNFHDHSDTIKKTQYQYADLDDLNTANPMVRKALRNSYNYWIEKVGVDGFRFDTPHFVEHEFWNDFMHSADEEDLGIEKFAAKMGKEEFLSLGETAVFPYPYDNTETYRAAAFIGTQENPRIASILNFPLTMSIQRVFQELKPTSLLSYRLEQNFKIFDRSDWLGNFIDNHDGARFLTKADHASFQQALLFIMTIPGIPIVYYGTEQRLLGMRQAMFKGGTGSPNQDQFDTSSDAFHFVQSLIKLRKANDIFRKGAIKVLRDSRSGPGVFIYSLDHDGEQVIVGMNTSEQKILVDQLESDFEAGTLLKTQFSIDDSKKTLEVGDNGRLNFLLPAKSAYLWRAEGNVEQAKVATSKITLNELSKTTISTNTLHLTGQANDLSELKVVIDGDYTRAVLVTISNDQWKVELPLSNLLNGTHQVTAFVEEENHLMVSNSQSFEINFPTRQLAIVKDKKKDDYGPFGTYSYPSHKSYSKQMDIESVKVYSKGTNMKVDVTMGEITQMWLPPNGFDHCLLNIYIDLPEKKGTKALPLQNATMPNGADWDYLVSVAGFGNASYSSEGASGEKVGKQVGPSAAISVDKERRTISFSISAALLEYPTSLKGIKLYVNTWGGGPDGLRGMNMEPSDWNFSGGKPIDPKIMDDVPLIVLE